MNSGEIPQTYIKNIELARAMATAEKPFRDQISEFASPLAMFHLGDAALHASQVVEEQYFHPHNPPEAIESTPTTPDLFRPFV